MNRKESIHYLLKEIKNEILEFIKEHESSYKDRWVPSTFINDQLSLKFIAVPKSKGQKETGWLFSIIARILEDENLIEYHEVNRRAYYRSV